MQLMAERGLEHVETKGFGWIDGDVKVIAPEDASLKIPHMGWNTLDTVASACALRRHRTRRQTVFMPISSIPIIWTCSDPAALVATADYGGAVTAFVAPRQYGGQPVPSREEPGTGPGTHRQFSEMAAMILFPAIDLKGGQCVRLKLGDMAQATVFNDDPAAQARSFEAQGFSWLHLVDLDGAFAGRPVNAPAVEAILASVSIPVQLGGGIREHGDRSRPGSRAASAA